MSIFDFGYTEYLKHCPLQDTSNTFELGRVLSEHKERYTVATNKGECNAEITGNMRYSAKDREDFPSVGDWVFLSIYENNFAIIQAILPRYSVIKRRSVSDFGDSQIIASNIDCALITQSASLDFNINRIERYLTLCNESGIDSIIIITKIDLFSELELDLIIKSIKSRLDTIPIVLLSNENHIGLKTVNDLIEKGKTYCLLGSSGVGKSSLLNNLTNQATMETAAINDYTQKGRHTTSFRELLVLDNGGIIIDNPGMREVGLIDSEIGLDTTFHKIFELSKKCRFTNCTHTNEKSCAILEAIEKKELDLQEYENYQKMKRENEHATQTIAERHKKERAFGKMIKDFVKNKK